MTGSTDRLRIWLVQTGEEMPYDPGPPRLLRTALLARELVRRGHDVTFWNASFNHQQKLQRSHGTTSIDSGEGYRTILLQGRAYSRNISVARIRSQRENAAAFRSRSRIERAPDVILCGLPSLEMADAAAEYGTRHDVPVVIDCRDLWPDVIEEFVPKALKWIAAPMLANWRRMLRRATARATAITGVSQAFVAWGVRASGRKPGRWDRPFHLTYAAPTVSVEQLQAAEAYWDRELGGDPDALIGVYAGTLSRRFDLSTVAEAHQQLPDQVRGRIKLVICGKGDRGADFAAMAARDRNLIAAGWKNAAELHALMGRARFGLLPYHRSDDFVSTFPNKVGEYLYFGLPVMTGLGGTTGEMLAAYGLEIPYVPGDIASASSALARLAQQGWSRDAYRTKARQAFRDHFDPASVLPDFADYLEQIVENRTKHAQEHQ